jgi:hypothetical protein
MDNFSDISALAKQFMPKKVVSKDHGKTLNENDVLDVKPESEFIPLDYISDPTLTDKLLELCKKENMDARKSFELVDRMSRYNGELLRKEVLETLNLHPLLLERKELYLRISPKLQEIISAIKQSKEVSMVLEDSDKDEVKVTEESLKFEYMMLGRLKSDVDYYFGYGGESPRNLYYDSIQEHLSEMKKQYNAFPENLKPVWISLEEIVGYEKRGLGGYSATEADWDLYLVSQAVDKNSIPILSVAKDDGSETRRGFIEEAIRNGAVVNTSYLHSNLKEEIINQEIKRIQNDISELPRKALGSAAKRSKLKALGSSLSRKKDELSRGVFVFSRNLVLGNGETISEGISSIEFGYAIHLLEQSKMDTINHNTHLFVHGKLQPKHDSEGLPLAKTDAEIFSFWEKYNGSQLSAEGRPQPFYHKGNSIDLNGAYLNQDKSELLDDVDEDQELVRTFVLSQEVFTYDSDYDFFEGEFERDRERLSGLGYQVLSDQSGMTVVGIQGGDQFVNVSPVMANTKTLMKNNDAEVEVSFKASSIRDLYDAAVSAGAKQGDMVRIPYGNKSEYLVTSGAMPSLADLSQGFRSELLLNELAVAELPDSALPAVFVLTHKITKESGFIENIAKPYRPSQPDKDLFSNKGVTIPALKDDRIPKSEGEAVWLSYERAGDLANSRNFPLEVEFGELAKTYAATKISIGNDKTKLGLARVFYSDTANGLQFEELELASGSRELVSVAAQRDATKKDIITFVGAGLSLPTKQIAPINDDQENVEQKTNYDVVMEKEHVAYGLELRPYSFATVPPGETSFTPFAEIKEDVKSLYENAQIRHGIITYKEVLADKDVNAYQLVVLADIVKERSLVKNKENLQSIDIPTEKSVKETVENLADIKQENVAEMLTNAFAKSDDELELVIKTILKDRADLAVAINEGLDDIKYFAEDSSNVFVANLAKKLISEQEAHEFRDEIVERLEQGEFGIQLKGSFNHYALIGKDASTEGSVRATYFDDNGFFGHDTRPSYKELLPLLIKEGYTLEAAGSLEVMATKDAFIKGNEVLAIIQAYNSGQLTFDDLVALKQEGIEEDSKNAKVAFVSHIDVAADGIENLIEKDLHGVLNAGGEFGEDFLIGLYEYIIDNRQDLMIEAEAVMLEVGRVIQSLNSDKLRKFLDAIEKPSKEPKAIKPEIPDYVRDAVGRLHVGAKLGDLLLSDKDTVVLDAVLTGFSLEGDIKVRGQIYTNGQYPTQIRTLTQDELIASLEDDSPLLKNPEQNPPVDEKNLIVEDSKRLEVESAEPSSEKLERDGLSSTTETPTETPRGIHLVKASDIALTMSHLEIAENNLAEGNESITPDEAVDVHFNIDTGNYSLNDGYHRVLKARGGTVKEAIARTKAGDVPDIQSDVSLTKNIKRGEFSAVRLLTVEEIAEYEERFVDAPKATLEELLAASKKQDKERAIEDYGVKIPGAAKDRWSNFMSRLDMYHDIKDSTMTKYLPQPNYKSLAKAGVDKTRLALIASLYSIVSSVRTNRAKQKAAVVAKEKVIQVVKSSDDTAALVESVLDDSSSYLRGARMMFELLDNFESEEFGKISKYGITAGGETSSVFSFYNGKGNAVLNSRWVVAEDILGAGVGKIREELAMPAKKRGPAQIKLQMRVSNTRNYSIYWEKPGSKMVKIESLEEGLSRADAFQYLSDNRSRIEVEITAAKNMKMRREENAPRTGPGLDLDNPATKNITPAELGKAFGLKSVEFGNSLLSAQKEAQEKINLSYGALSDLAKIIKFDPEIIGLGETLSLALASRGGSNSNFSAHYEPLNKIINLTRNSGAGSLGHEVFHAIDNYLAIVGYQGVEERSKASGRMATRDLRESGRYSGGDMGENNEVRDAFVALRAVLDHPILSKRMAKFDTMKGKPYFNTVVEKGARYFEKYLIDELAKIGIRNDYLVNIIDVGDEKEGKCYPSTFEMEAYGITKAYDNLFDSMKTKTLDNIKVLYREASIEDGLYNAWAGAISNDADLFRYPTAVSSSLNEIFEDRGFKVKLDRVLLKDARLRDFPEAEDIERTSLVELKGDDFAYVYETADTVWLDVSTMTSGESGGSEVYQAVADYAFNTDKVFIGDPEGLSDIAVVRRTENMVSSALRHGTATHLQPHFTQVEGVDQEGGRLQNVATMPWTRNDGDNLETLLVTSYNNVLKHFPEIANVTYSTEQSEYRVSGDLTDSDLRSDRIVAYINGEFDQAGSHELRLKNVFGRELSPMERALAGSSTIQRAVISHTILQKQREENRGQDLLVNVKELFTSAMQNDAFNGVLYKSLEGAISKSPKVDQVEKWIASTEFHTGSNIRVVLNRSELPKHLSRNISESASGVYDTSTRIPYLIASNIRNEDHAIKVALHEAIGHMGVISFLDRNAEMGGSDTLAVIDKIFNDLGPDEITKSLGSYSLDLSNVKDRREAVLEYIAHIAEDGGSKAVNEVVTSKKSLLDNLYSKESVVWNRDDILDLIEAGRLNLVYEETIKRASISGFDFNKHSPAYEAAFYSVLNDAGGLRNLLGANNSGIETWHGTASEIETFSTEFIGTGEGAQSEGWGLYTSGSKAVGEIYSNSIASEQTEVNGVKYSIRELADSYSAGEPEHRALNYYLDAGANWIEAERLLDVDLSDHEGSAKIEGERVRAIIADMSGKISPLDGRNLYSVKLDVESSKMLDLDKPLKAQSNFVKLALKPYLGGLHITSLAETVLPEWKSNYLSQLHDIGLSEQEVAAHSLAVDTIVFNDNDSAEAWSVLNTIADGEITADVNELYEISSNSGTNYYGQEINGGFIYDQFMAKGITSSPETTSDLLSSIGISGNKYLNGFARTQAPQSNAFSPEDYNYVVFDDTTISIAKTADEVAKAENKSEAELAAARGIDVGTEASMGRANSLGFLSDIYYLTKSGAYSQLAGDGITSTQTLLNFRAALTVDSEIDFNRIANSPVEIAKLQEDGFDSVKLKAGEHVFVFAGNQAVRADSLFIEKPEIENLKATQQKGLNPEAQSRAIEQGFGDKVYYLASKVELTKSQLDSFGGGEYTGDFVGETVFISDSPMEAHSTLDLFQDDLHIYPVRLMLNNSAIDDGLTIEDYLANYPVKEQRQSPADRLLAYYKSSSDERLQYAKDEGHHSSKELGLPMVVRSTTSSFQEFHGGVPFLKNPREVVENNTKHLDMSDDARMKRSINMGFGEKSWFHGGNQTGFKEPEGTMFFSDERSIATTYHSGNDRDAPLYRGSQLFDDPGLVEELFISKSYVVVDDSNEVLAELDEEHADPDELIENYEFSEGEFIGVRYNIEADGDRVDSGLTKEEAILCLDEIEFNDGGVMEVKMKTAPDSVLQVDFNGENWDQGPVQEWVLYDENHEVVEFYHDEEEAESDKEEGMYVEPGVRMTTNEWVTHAKDMGFDGVEFLNIIDEGAKGSGYGSESTVRAVWGPGIITKAVDAGFDPDAEKLPNIMLKQELDLDMATSARKDRAQEMGFDVENPVFRGMQEVSMQGSEPEIIWTTHDSDYANSYASPWLGNPSNMTKGYVKYEKPFDFGFRSTMTDVNAGDVAGRMELAVNDEWVLDRISDEVAENLLNQIDKFSADAGNVMKPVFKWWEDHSEIKTILTTAGFDAILSMEGIAEKSSCVGVFGADQFASQHEAFNPAYEEMPGLLCKAEDEVSITSELDIAPPAERTTLTEDALEHRAKALGFSTAITYYPHKSEAEAGYLFTPNPNFDIRSKDEQSFPAYLKLGKPRTIVSENIWSSLQSDPSLIDEIREAGWDSLVLDVPKKPIEVLILNEDDVFQLDFDNTEGLNLSAQEIYAATGNFENQKRRDRAVAQNFNMSKTFYLGVDAVDDNKILFIANNGYDAEKYRDCLAKTVVISPVVLTMFHDLASTDSSLDGLLRDFPLSQEIHHATDIEPSDLRRISYFIASESEKLSYEELSGKRVGALVEGLFSKENMRSTADLFLLNENEVASTERKQRAKDKGLMTGRTLYHGSFNISVQFEPADIGSWLGGKAVHLTSDPVEASSYASESNHDLPGKADYLSNLYGISYEEGREMATKGAGNVTPVWIKDKSTLLIDAGGLSIDGQFINDFSTQKMKSIAGFAEVKEADLFLRQLSRLQNEESRFRVLAENLTGDKEFNKGEAISALIRTSHAGGFLRELAVSLNADFIELTDGAAPSPGGFKGNTHVISLYGNDDIQSALGMFEDEPKLEEAPKMESVTIPPFSNVAIWNEYSYFSPRMNVERIDPIQGIDIEVLSPSLPIGTDIVVVSSEGLSNTEEADLKAVGFFYPTKKDVDLILPISEESKKLSASNVRFLLGGNKSSFVKGNLEKAIEMTEAKASRQEIWKETGWEKGADEEWKFEISDIHSEIKKEITDEIVGGTVSYGQLKLGDLLKHDDLYKQYPAAENIHVELTAGDRAGVVSGGYIGRDNQINLKIGPDSDIKKVKGVLLHEIQHFIQEVEGFAMGGRVDKQFQFEIVKSLRAVAERSIDHAADNAFNRSISDLQELGSIKAWQVFNSLAVNDNITRMAKQVYQADAYSINYQHLTDNIGVPPAARNLEAHKVWLQKASQILADKTAEGYESTYRRPLAEGLRIKVGSAGVNAINNKIAKIRRDIKNLGPDLEKNVEKRDGIERLLENFSLGKMSTKMFYASLAGEVEANNVKDRSINMPQQALEMMPPSWTQSMTNEKQLVYTDKALASLMAFTPSVDLVESKLASLNIKSMDTVVVESFEDLPDVVKYAAKGYGTENVSGANFKNTMYLVSDNLDSQDKIDEAILHELAHEGVKTVFGQEISGTYNNFWNNIGKESGLVSNAVARGIDLDPYVEASSRMVKSGAMMPSDRVTMLVDEFVAHNVQRRSIENSGEKVDRLISEFVGGVREILRKNELLTSSTMSAADIAFTMKCVNDQALEKGGVKTPSILTVDSLADQGKHTWKWANDVLSHVSNLGVPKDEFVERGLTEGWKELKRSEVDNTPFEVAMKALLNNGKSKEIDPGKIGIYKEKGGESGIIGYKGIDGVVVIDRMASGSSMEVISHALAAIKNEVKAFNLSIEDRRAEVVNVKEIEEEHDPSPSPF